MAAPAVTVRHDWRLGDAAGATEGRPITSGAASATRRSRITWPCKPALGLDSGLGQGLKARTRWIGNASIGPKLYNRAHHSFGFAQA